jgi:hypothetical protein
MIFLDDAKLSEALGELVRVVHDEYAAVPCFDLHDAVTLAIKAVVGQYMEKEDD